MLNRISTTLLLALLGGCAVFPDGRPLCAPGECHAVMLSNLDTDCTASGGVITCSRESAAANVVVASAELEASFTRLDDDTVLFTDVASWPSQRGASPIVLSTPRGEVTATWGGDRYTITGLVRPFVGAETLTVTAPGASPAVDPVVLTAPSAPRFGALAGLATEVLVADGTFDVLFVYARDAAGRTGILRELHAADMALRGGDRVAPILPESVRTALASRGVTLAAVTVGPYRQVSNESLFPGTSVPVQAGYLLDVPVAELGSTPSPTDAGSGLDGGGMAIDGGVLPDAPGPPPADANLDANGSGPIVDVRCEDLAADFPGFVDFAGSSPQLNLTVCLDASGCHVTNDFRRRDPIQPYQCALEDQVFRISYDGFAAQWIAAPANDWTTRWSTTGVARTWPRTTPAGAELSSVVERPDGTRYRIDYRIDTASIHVGAVVPVDPPVPPYGATDDCERMPRTYDTSVELYGTDVYARVCIETLPYPSCNVAGDIDASPEDESCVEPFALGVDPSTGEPVAMANFPYGPGGGDPELESASAGTITDGVVTGIPTGVPVTFVVVMAPGASETFRHAIVAEWTGTTWIVESVTAL